MSLKSATQADVEIRVQNVNISRIKKHLDPQLRLKLYFTLNGED